MDSPDDDALDLVTVAKNLAPDEARLAQTLLETAEIESWLADEATVQMNWLLMNAVGGVKVRVRAADAERAREIFNQELGQVSDEQLAAESDAAGILVRPAAPADLEEVRAMFREYEAWLGVDLCFQSFQEEVASLPGKYAPPEGRLLLAEVGGDIAGVVALRPHAAAICEMKRLFVRPAFHGRGVGRELVERVIEEARAAGYRRMRLDTMPDRMPAAVALYETLGFHDIPAYYDNPIAGARYLEKSLA